MFHIIVNPSSSSGRGKSKWDKIEKRFRQCGVPYKVHFSSRSNTIEKICAELTSKGEDCDLVILGGDGTMNAVVNGIRDFEHTRVGFIQTGSGNDLVKGIGISRRRDELVDSILRGRVVRTCDIGRVTYHNQSSLLDPFTHRPLAPSCCRDRLPQIACPTLVLGATDDRIVSGAASRELASRIPGALLHMFEGYSHGAIDEAPDFHEWVVDFFR